MTWAPDWLAVPLHSWVTLGPAVNDQAGRQLVTGSPRLSTVTVALNPPGHRLVTA